MQALRELIRQNKLFTWALGLGALIRLFAVLGYPGALWFAGDSYVYLGAALRPQPNLSKSTGYSLFLRLLLPYWYDAIVPDLAAGRTVLAVAHGNSLRALVKHLEGISDTDIAALNIPTGIPLLYELDADFRPAGKGRYLDPERAIAAAEEVRNQGR